MITYGFKSEKTGKFYICSRKVSQLVNLMGTSWVDDVGEAYIEETPRGKVVIAPYSLVMNKCKSDLRDELLPEDFPGILEGRSITITPLPEQMAFKISLFKHLRLKEEKVLFLKSEIAELVYSYMQGQLI